MKTEAPTTLPRALAYAAHSFGERLAVVDGEVRLTYNALNIAVLKAAASFLRDGIGRGDRVAIWAPNSWHWIVACLGAQTIGAIIVPLNTRLKGDEATFILQRSRACMLLTAGTFLGIDHASLVELRRLPSLGRVLRFDADWQEFLADNGDLGAAAEAGRVVASSDPSDILFTSGTTGAPKGVVTTHGQTIRVFTLWIEQVGLNAGDSYLIINPFFHTFGYKAGWLACILAGATAFPMAKFDAGEAALLVEREGITVLPGPPSLFIALLQHGPLRDAQWAPLASLRLAVTGAASVAPELITRMREDLGIETVLTGYGLTETCGVVTMSQPDDDAETVATSCGRAIPGVEIRIAGNVSTDAEIGETGEVLVRGFNVMAGYFEDQQATDAVIDEQGWLHTGDIGWLDDRGYLRITDRLKDMYVSGGFNCYPAEIERLIAGHPAVAQVAVIGIPDEKMGEVGMAFVILKANASTTACELVAWAKDRMANYKAPRRVIIVPFLPLNAAGKVLKTVLRQTAEFPTIITKNGGTDVNV